MATLALLGALERCPAFPTGSFNVARMARVYSRVESDRSFLQEVRALARRKGDRALQIAIDLSLKRSARLNRLLFVAKGLRSRPVVGRLARSLERSMAARSFI
jgi:hypothetical protein